ncbi:MAG: metal ABC transporter substrate-binding protein, partial [Bacteroides sp.]|nr:metal ABC transporter substrate-binding protein [Bacteroides sp.]
LLGGIDPANADVYAANAAAYTARLDALDGEYRAAIESAAKKTLIFGDRFPFRYLVDDYGLDYYAAFPGCSAETEASFETVIFLAAKADEIGADAILTLKGSDQRIAEAVVNNTKDREQTILTLDPMQSVSLAEAEGGTTYLSIARDNLEILKQALGAEGGSGE